MRKLFFASIARGIVGLARYTVAIGTGDKSAYAYAFASLWVIQGLTILARVLPESAVHPAERFFSGLVYIAANVFAGFILLPAFVLRPPKLGRIGLYLCAIGAAHGFPLYILWSMFSNYHPAMFDQSLPKYLYLPFWLVSLLTGVGLFHLGRMIINALDRSRRRMVVGVVIRIR